MSTEHEPPPTTRYRVRYYDAEKSRRGQGVQSRTFDSRADAERFAEGRILYAKPAKVEVV